eukprot:407688-Karenia_brevis.AAC.1
MGLPQALQSFFTLPSVDAWQLGLTEINGVPVAAHTGIMAEICVLPMGWSHALHCCQSVMLHAIERAGISERRVVSDQAVCQPIVEAGDVLVAGYVDNFAVLGAEASTVNVTRDKISK